MIEAGRPAPLGATCDGEGVNFSLYSSSATDVDVCLFDGAARETARIRLPRQTDGVWHGYLPRCRAGQRYGYRVHGEYAPDKGLRFNANKLLIDPYARELDGALQWSTALFDFIDSNGKRQRNDMNSAPYVPKCLALNIESCVQRTKPVVSWAETVIYEANVRGYTMRHPDVPKSDRGRFRGLANGEILRYLKSLGITTIELMPVQSFIDEQFLVDRGLTNFWGYNPINFFVAEGRYTATNPRAEFSEMVNAIHDAGMEVLLDVAYNHTGESDGTGPTVSYRGIDNLCYYRMSEKSRGEYVDHTGCGNTINTDHSQVRRLILDSLRYWSQDMGVDGFRFDLATVLGRTTKGFANDHPLLLAIKNDEDLSGLKLIAEPWDPGHEGYQLGGFRRPFAEWNDRYRDSVRRFWRGDTGEAAELAGRLLGSADLFEASGRQPFHSINFLTAHDGFTLADVVSFEKRHNRDNGEQNRDGHGHNFSCNYGVEGATGDDSVIATRRKQRLNMLATLLFSQGTPMLLAGDELGNSQAGNNNAYAQDNEKGWLDWSGLHSDPDFVLSVGKLIRIRKKLSLLKQPEYLHGKSTNHDGWKDVAWLRPDGSPMKKEDWREARALSVVLASPSGSVSSASIALLLNPTTSSIDFKLPEPGNRRNWRKEFSTDSAVPLVPTECRVLLSTRSLALLELTDPGTNT